MMKLSQLLSCRRACKGQGVVEYAGALVVAAVIVGLVITNGAPAISTLFTSVTTGISTFLTSKIPT